MLATRANVEALLLRALTAAEAEHFDALAAMADAAVEAELPGLALEPGAETATVRVNADGEVWTPRYPVVSVASLTIDGSPVLVDEPVDAYGPLRAPSAADWRSKWAPSWPDGAVAQVTYAFGFDVPPPGLALIAAEALVVAMLGPRGGLQQEQLGDHMQGFRGSVIGGAVRFDEAQLRKLRRFRRRIDSATIRRSGP